VSFLVCEGKQENYEEPPFVIDGAGDTLARVTRKRPLIKQRRAAGAATEGRRFGFLPVA
jgi:hypothetical protein